MADEIIGVAVTGTSDIEETIGSAVEALQAEFASMLESTLDLATALSALSEAFTANTASATAAVAATSEMAVASDTAAASTKTLYEAYLEAAAAQKEVWASQIAAKAAIQDSIASVTGLGAALTGLNQYNKSAQESFSVFAAAAEESEASLSAVGLAAAGGARAQRLLANEMKASMVEGFEFSAGAKEGAMMSGVLKQAVEGITASMTAEQLAAANAARMQQVFSQAVREASAGTLVWNAATETMEAAATHGALSMTRLANALRAMMDELASGRMRQFTGTLFRTISMLTESVGITLSWTVALVAAAAAIGYITYEAYALNKEMNELTGQYALQGRAIADMKGYLEDEYESLRKIPGASRSIVEAFMEADASHAELGAQMLTMAHSIMPELITAFGSEAPKAYEKLLTTLNDLSEDGFKRLDREMLNTTPAQYETISNLIQMGDKAGAAREILEILAARGGGAIETLDQKIGALHEQLASAIIQMDAAAAAGGRMSSAYLEDARNVDSLRASLKRLQDVRAKDEGDQASNQEKNELADARRITGEMNAQQEILAKIAELKHGLAGADKNNADVQKQFTDAIAIEEKKLTDEQHKQLETQFRDYVATQNATVGEASRGSAARIAVLQNEKAEAVALFGATSKEAQDKQTEINEAEREGTSESKRLNEEQYRNALSNYESQARAFKEGSTERLAILAQELALAKRMEGEKSTQYNQIEGQITENIRAAAQERAQAQIAAYNTETRALDETYSRVVETEREKVRTHELTADQVGALEQREAQAIYQIELDLLNKELQLDNLSVQEKQRIADQKVSIEQQLANRIQQIRTQSAQVEDQIEESLSKKIQSTANSEIVQMIQGRQTLRGAIASIGDQILAHEVELILKNTWAYISGENTKTAAVETGTAIRTATVTTGAATEKAVTASTGATSIVASAHDAAAGAYASVVHIPIIGPALAPIAAGVAYAAVMAYDVFSAAGGMEIPSGMNPIIQAHANETVLPSDLAVPLGQALRGGAFGGGAQSGPQINLTVHAVDATSFANVLMSNNNAIVSALQMALRQLNPAFRNA